MERDGRATTGSLVQGAAASNDVEPAPPGAWSWLERHGLWLIVLVCTGWRAWLAWPYQAALVMRDEAGYLGNAAALAGYVFDGASSYHAGYSLLIVPAYLLFSDPAQIYRCVQVINLLLGIASTCLLYNLVASLFPGERRERILLAVLVGSLYPAWFVLSSLAMSENASIPTFLLALWSCLQVARRGGGWWIAWALSTGFLFTIHPTGIASIGAGVLVAAALAAARGEWKWLLAFIAAIAVVVLATTSLLQPWLVQRLTLGSFPPNLHYPSLGAMLEPMRSMAGIVGLANHFAGHVLYLLVGTLWLVWFAAQHAAHGLHRSVTQRALPGDVAVLAFAMLALLGTLGMSVVMFTAFRTVQLDHLMYGRYVEVSLLPLLACGFIVATRRGSFTSFKAVCRHLHVQFELFSPDGTPIRALAAMTLVQVEKDARSGSGTPAPAQNPTTRAERRVRSHTVRDGDSLPLLAHHYLGDANRWREIAVASGIDDPLRLERGRRLEIPG